MQTAGRLFLKCSAGKLREHLARIEDCLSRLSEEQIWTRGGANENAVGNLVLHLCGNVHQWIVSGAGGRPDVRERNKEFDARGGAGAAELAAALRATVDEAAAVLEAFPEERLAARVVIQNYDVTLLEAIYHVVEHFSGHTGQIIFATKLMTGADLGYYAHLRATRAGKTP